MVQKGTSQYKLKLYRHLIHEQPLFFIWVALPRCVRKWSLMTSDVDACSRLVHDCSLYRAWQRGQGYGTEQITTPYTAAPKLDINHELLLLLPSNQALTGQSHCLSNLTSSTVGGSPGSSAAPKQSCGRKKRPQPFWGAVAWEVGPHAEDFQTIKFGSLESNCQIGIRKQRM